jgi:hypothetical protein
MPGQKQKGKPCRFAQPQEKVKGAERIFMSENIEPLCGNKILSESSKIDFGEESELDVIEGLISKLQSGLFSIGFTLQKDG